VERRHSIDLGCIDLHTPLEQFAKLRKPLPLGRIGQRRIDLLPIARMPGKNGADMSMRASQYLEVGIRSFFME
jgi:hypothetical protein